MTAVQKKATGLTDQCDFAFDGSIAVAVGDLMFHDTNDVKPVSSQADQGTEAANQALAAPLFAGIANDARTVSDTGAVTSFPVITDAIVEIDCSSAAFEVGDKVTFVNNGGGTALENQKVAKTTDETLAIGYAVKRYGSATTRVLCRLISRVVRHAASPDVTANLVSATLPLLTFNGATGVNKIAIPDNLASALQISEGSNKYLEFVSTDSGEGVNLYKSLTISDAKDIVLNTTTGTKIGTAVGQKLAFHNSTPVVQRSGAAQAAVATTAATNSTPYGYAQAQADAIVTLVNEIRATLVEKGLMKGAA